MTNQHGSPRNLAVKQTKKQAKKYLVTKIECDNDWTTASFHEFITLEEAQNFIQKRNSEYPT